MTRRDSYRLHGPVLFSHPDVFRPARAGAGAVLVRYVAFAFMAASGAAVATIGAGAPAAVLTGVGVLLHVAADILALRRFTRTGGRS